MRIPPDFLVSGSAASLVGPFSKVTQQVWSGMSASLPQFCFVPVVLPSCLDLFGSTLSGELHAPFPVVFCCSSLLLLWRSIPLSLDAPSQPSSYVGHLNSLQSSSLSLLLYVYLTFQQKINFKKSVEINSFSIVKESIIVVLHSFYLGQLRAD